MSNSSPSAPLVLNILVNSYLSTVPSSNKSRMIGSPPDSHTNVPILFSKAKHSYFLIFSLIFTYVRIEGTNIILYILLTLSN